MELQKSFSSANIDIPVKMFKNRHFAESVQRGRIVPLHIQWMPTNKCNANCSFCSCFGRDKKLSLSIEDSRNTIETFAHLGTRAVTITGGGEPMLYPYIYDLFDVFQKNRIEIGLVSNALNITEWELNRMQRFRWVRLSVSDEYTETGFQKIAAVAAELESVDMALSYVVTKKPNPSKMRAALTLANERRMSHIRFVFDIRKNVDIKIDTEAVFENMDISRVIFQSRSEYVPGRRDCLLSLAKPLVYADGFIYPCCGTQYATAQAEAAGEMLSDFRMGSLGDISDIWRHQWPFDGTRCEKCYYDNYNRFLSMMIDDVKHIDFV